MNGLEVMSSLIRTLDVSVFMRDVVLSDHVSMKTTDQDKRYLMQVLVFCGRL